MTAYIWASGVGIAVIFIALYMAAMGDDDQPTPPSSSPYL